MAFENIVLRTIFDLLKYFFTNKACSSASAKLDSIDFFIGKLVSILCDPNTNNNYSNELLEFRKLDLELYEIVNNLIQKTLNFDIDKKDIFNSYRDISFEFYENLKNWVTMKL